MHMSGAVRRISQLVAGGLIAGLLVAGAGAASQAAEPTGAPRASSPTRALNVLVLGDSYSAGNGATDDQGNEQYYGPADCYRSKVDWGEKYAAALRAAGQPVNLVNHACSGGVTADFTNPRVMDTSAPRTAANPSGATTQSAADAALTAADPCDTGQFPDEESWTYASTVVTPLVITYTCTRTIRPQIDFITPDTDLVLFTMGGNDIKFSTIVTDCFILKNGASCKADIDAATALLPTVRQRLLGALAAMRAHGLRDDAKIVQLGYPLLQVDNDYRTPDGYQAGNAIRAFGLTGNAAIAAAVPEANAGHPGQVAFLGGVPEKFAGHEPDASTPTGNPDRWINQLDGTNSSFFYHPNRLGQTAYASLLAAQGTFGATPTGKKLEARLRVRLSRVGRTTPGRSTVRLRVKVRLNDEVSPRGKVVVRGLPGRHRLAVKKLRTSADGRLRITVRLRTSQVKRLQVTYRDASAPAVTVTRRLRNGSR